ELARRMAGLLGGQERERASRVRDPDLRQVDSRRDGLDDRGHRSLIARLPQMRVAVRLLSANGHEDVTRSDRARVVLHALPDAARSSIHLDRAHDPGDLGGVPGGRFDQAPRGERTSVHRVPFLTVLPASSDWRTTVPLPSTRATSIALAVSRASASRSARPRRSGTVVSPSPPLSSASSITAPPPISVPGAGVCAITRPPTAPPDATRRP